jgi:DNA-binding transcriptional ArsR family regulator
MVAGPNICKEFLIYRRYFIYDGNVSKKLDEVVSVMKVLANPIRLRMIASLYESPKHVYALAKEMGLSYPLALLYLRSLEEAGLVESTESKEIGEREKKVYRVKDFALQISPKEIASIVKGEKSGQG